MFSIAFDGQCSCYENPGKTAKMEDREADYSSGLNGKAKEQRDLFKVMGREHGAGC